MYSRYNILLKAGIIFIIFQYFSCQDLGIALNSECTTKKDYIFHIPVEISPNKYEFEIGDTITIDFDFSDTLVDSTENKKYIFEDYKGFLPAVRFISLNNNGEDRFFFKYADTSNMQLKNMFIQHYPNKHNDAGIGFDFDYKNNRYYASLSFILKKKGIYYLKIQSEADQKFPEHFEGFCKYRQVVFFIKHPYDTNFDLVKWLLYPNSTPKDLELGKADEYFASIGGYAFKVK